MPCGPSIGREPTAPTSFWGRKPAESAHARRDEPMTYDPWSGPKKRETNEPAPGRGRPHPWGRRIRPKPIWEKPKPEKSVHQHADRHLTPAAILTAAGTWPPHRNFRGDRPFFRVRVRLEKRCAHGTAGNGNSGKCPFDLGG